MQIFTSSIIKSISLSIACLAFVSCGGNEETPVNAQTPEQSWNWKMVTAWPKNFPGLGTAPERFAEMVEEMSGGRMKIRVYGAGELVPALEVFDAVNQGTAEIGHGSGYYWKGKVPEAQFFSVLPFGMNGREMEGWISYGGGQALWDELYAPFNLIPMRGGNTGVQMGGWFNKEINSAADFQGLKMRIPGLAGDVLTRLGGVVVNIAGGELYTAMQTGVLDATEWVSPYNDLAFGFQEIAEYYYYPGWHEAGTVIEFIFNKEEFDQLPSDMQAILRTAAQATDLSMTDEFTARNAIALQEFADKHGVIPRKFPDDLLRRLKEESAIVIEELGHSSQMAERIYASYLKFESQSKAWREISEEAYDKAREL
jgi:TRAP-type mannitol/chloroaromatic compound transport system substrate-binding protein